MEKVWEGSGKRKDSGKRVGRSGERYMGGSLGMKVKDYWENQWEGQLDGSGRGVEKDWEGIGNGVGTEVVKE